MILYYFKNLFILAHLVCLVWFILTVLLWWWFYVLLAGPPRLCRQRVSSCWPLGGCSVRPWIGRHCSIWSLRPRHRMMVLGGPLRLYAGVWSLRQRIV